MNRSLCSIHQRLSNLPLRIAKSVAVFSMLCFALVPIGEAQARCIRQSLLNHDYCGIEGSKIGSKVPERVIGDFKGSCAGHDACYSLGAEQIVGMMERRYRQSMLSATKKQKKEFSSEISRIRSQCDSQFLFALNRSCNRVALSGQIKCREASGVYYVAVRALAGGAFEGALDQAFTCRTR